MASVDDQCVKTISADKNVTMSKISNDMQERFIEQFIENYTEQDAAAIYPDWSEDIDLNCDFRQHVIDLLVSKMMVQPEITRDLLDAESNFCAHTWGGTKALKDLGERYVCLTDGKFFENYDRCRQKSFDCESVLFPRISVQNQ